jgi:hypothetical protein
MSLGFAPYCLADMIAACHTRILPYIKVAKMCLLMTFKLTILTKTVEHVEFMLIFYYLFIGHCARACLFYEQ